MATQSPFSWLADTLGQLPRAWPRQWPGGLAQALTPPPWAMQELQQRLVLFLNHVLMNEPAARERLRRVSGRSVQVCWRDQQLHGRFTPAGLLELCDAADSGADLVLRVSQDSPLELARLALQGEKPPVRIEGDVQLAAEVNWLIDHVRWEPEEDLARLIGDAPAHTVVQTAQRLAQALRAFVQQRAARKAQA